MSSIEIGRLLRASTSGCVVGCRVTQMSAPAFGGMVRIQPGGGNGMDIFGLIYDIHVDDDGLVRQLVVAENVAEEIIQDNRLNRNVPVEVSVLFIGYTQNGQVLHLLPPRPPLTLDAIFPCEPDEMCTFTSAGRFGYFRHVLRSQDLPVGELLTAHLRQVQPLQRQAGNPGWAAAAMQELIILMRDDYPTLMGVLGALGDASLEAV